MFYCKFPSKSKYRVQQFPRPFSGAGSGSIFSIRFSNRDFKRVFVKELYAINQANQLRGGSQHYRIRFEAKKSVPLHFWTKRQWYKTL